MAKEDHRAGVTIQGSQIQGANVVIGVEVNTAITGHATSIVESRGEQELARALVSLVNAVIAEGRHASDPGELARYTEQVVQEASKEKRKPAVVRQLMANLVAAAGPIVSVSNAAKAVLELVQAGLSP